MKRTKNPFHRPPVNILAVGPQRVRKCFDVAVWHDYKEHPGDLLTPHQQTAP